MANSGKELESLVKTVENVLLPLGFKISLRDRVFDDEGHQIAEFDILVSGKLGTTEINWLIECRDRPSDGVAPGSWIEQLVGRRDRFNFNKVTAVSTTGFSISAREYADKAGIELRSVKKIQPEDILSWSKLEKITIVKCIGDLKNVRIFITDANEEQEREIAELFKKLDNKSKIFIHTSTNKSFCLNDIWIEVMNKSPNLDENVIPGSGPRRKTIDVNYTNPDSRYKLISQGKDIPIERILFTGDISIVIKSVPISNITKYSNEQSQDSIAETIHFDLNDANSNLDLAIHKINDQGENKLVVTSERNETE